MLAVVVYGQITAQFYFPAAQLLLTLFLAIALSQNLNTLPPESSNPQRLTKPVVRPFLAVVCCLAVFCLTVSVTDVMNRSYQLYQYTHYNYPRFWLNGNFHRFPDRSPLPQVIVCKVHKYAPPFSCR